MKSPIKKLLGKLPLCLFISAISDVSFAQSDYASNSTYATGDYRMAFTEYAREQYAEGYRVVHPLTVDQKIKAMYDQLFKTGNGSTQRIMYDALDSGGNPTGLKFIKDVNPIATSNDIRSEGMSYGMMVAVMMDDKATFDALWGFARRFMYNNADGGEWYAWSLADTAPNYPMNRDGTKYGQNPAPDAEEYFAMALFFADHRWGSTSGQNDLTNYRRWANDTLRILRSTQGSTLWDQAQNMVKFSPYQTFTDPSYHVPAFYELWGLWADNNKAEWSAAADVSRQFFMNSVDDASGSNTGLFPEYAGYDGTPQATNFNPLSQHSAFDAFRVIQNIAVDHYWWSKNTNMNALTEGIMNFYNSDTELATPVGGPLAQFQYTGVYALGTNTAERYITVPGTWSNRATAPVPGLAAMNAVGALATDELYAPKFVQYLWDLQTPTDNGRYYDGLLQLFGYLHLSGYYRIYAAGEGNSLDLSMHTTRVDANNNPIIYWKDITYFTVAGCPQGQSATGTFTWTMKFLADRDGVPGPDYPSKTGNLTALSNGRYLGEIPAVHPSHYEYELSVTRKCNNTDLTETVSGYVDPSGYVRTTRGGYPVVGAKVTLFQTQTNDAASNLLQLPNGSTQMAPYNRRNPDYTDSTGHFGWDVTPGHWYQVRASHPDCFVPNNPTQKTVSTPLMFVPPEVTNLDIRLDCPGSHMKVKTTINNDWGSGYCADVLVTNDNWFGVDWKVRFNVNGKIDSLWNASYTQQGAVVNAEGISSNNILAAGTSTTIGLCATRNTVPTSYPITIRARGTSGAEKINLTVGGTVVATWNLTTSFKNYTVTTQLGGGINVVYTNDNGVANRDVVVDYADINNVRHQTEHQTQNTSIYGNGTCGGGSKSEWMHCSGWVGFNAVK